MAVMEMLNSPLAPYLILFGLAVLLGGGIVLLIGIALIIVFFKLALVGALFIAGLYMMIFKRRTLIGIGLMAGAVVLYLLIHYVW